MNNTLKQYSIEAAYHYCQHITKLEWKNKWQTITMLLFPREQRKVFYVLLAFICLVDDIVDEGLVSIQEREIQLQQFNEQLTQCYTADSVVTQPFFIALKDVIQRYTLSPHLFQQFMLGMAEDLRRDRFDTLTELLLYCQQVSNAPGQIGLTILGYREEKIIGYADFLSTGAQLLDFLLDLPEDLAKGRLYIPLNDLKQFHCSEQAIFQHEVTPEFMALMQFEADRVEKFIGQGRPILHYLRKRERFAITIVIKVCELLIKKIRKANYNVFVHQIKLTRLDKLFIIIKSLVA